MYMDDGVGNVTTDGGFHVGVICSLTGRYFCKTSLYNLAL